MRILLFGCAALLLIAACKNSPSEKTKIINQFPFTKTITGEYITFDKMPFCPDYITIIDSLIIVKNLQFCDSFIFYVYNKKTNRFICSFGTKGKGPTEFLKPKPTGQFENNGNSIGMWIYDFNKLIYEFINVTKTIELGKTVIERKFLAPKSVDVGLEVFILDNNDLLGSSMSPKGRLFYFNAKDKITQWVDYFPQVSYPPQREKQMHNLYRSSTRISPDKKFIVSALRLFKRIDVFNIKTEHLFSLVFKDSPKEPDFYVDKKNPISGTLVHYYTDIYLSDKYIYALNSQITQEQLMKDIDTGFSEVQVFNFDGVPVCSYRLDHFIGSFAIDEENKNIFGITLPNEDNSSSVIRYKIQ